jgi:hypothetical protein
MGGFGEGGFAERLAQKVIKRKDFRIGRRNDHDGEIVHRHDTDLEAGKPAGAFELIGGVAISVLPWPRPTGIVNRSFPIAAVDVAVGDSARS